MLDDPAYFERLRERVEILFPATRSEWFDVGQPLSIEVDVKNVDTLLVKVFEIDTFNYYRGEGKEIDASIELDGLVAGEERAVDLEVGPLRRVRRRFDFPGIADRPGVWIVEFLGNGIASRAIVRKGRMDLVAREAADGQHFRVLDGAGQPVAGATLWLGGREYQPSSNGEIVVPYSTDPGRKQAIVRHGDYASLEQIQHQAENYRLEAAIHIDREELLPGRQARVVVQPRLLLNGYALGLDVLERPTLSITAWDHDGTSSAQVLNGIELPVDGAGFVHQIQVRERMARITHD